MKTKLLKKLRKGFKLVYYPATSVSREHWIVFFPSDYANNSNTYFTFEKAFTHYQQRVHNYLSDHIQRAKSKQIF